MQERARAKLTSTCVIERPSDDEPTLDRETGRLTPAEPTTVYEGPCSVQLGGGEQTRQTAEGDAQVTLAGYLVRIPAEELGARKGDVVRFTSIGEDDNAELLDAELDVLRPDRRMRRATTMLPCASREHEDPLP